MCWLITDWNSSSTERWVSTSRQTLRRVNTTKLLSATRQRAMCTLSISIPSSQDNFTQTTFGGQCEGMFGRDSSQACYEIPFVWRSGMQLLLWHDSILSFTRHTRRVCMTVSDSDNNSTTNPVLMNNPNHRHITNTQISSIVWWQRLELRWPHYLHSYSSYIPTLTFVFYRSTRLIPNYYSTSLPSLPSSSSLSSSPLSYLDNIPPSTDSSSR